MSANQHEKKFLIRTRFAPSPTGELHIGGARTALFNYLWAKQKRGKFILRVEDTDTQRNQAEFIKRQYEDLGWLGLKPDESIFQVGNYGSYRQSQRLDIYQKYLRQLLAEKKAYYCFCSPTELAHEKEEYTQKNKRGNYQYSRKCLQLSEEQVNLFHKQKKSYLIRCQVPREENYQFVDLVRGQVVFRGRDIEDFVICRSNGIPLLNFAVVIDDQLMAISHVLRGEEHLSNTAKQLVLYEALGWTPPQFGHLSLILNSQKKKLSKRDPETSQRQLIKQLRELGYLPVAITNYLLLLGWHPGSTQEIFSLVVAQAKFNWTGCHSHGAVFSLAKLNWYNNYYIQQLGFQDFVEYSWQVLQKEYQLLPTKKKWAGQIALLFRPQLNYFQELVELTSYFFSPPPKKNKLTPPEWEKIKQLLAGIRDWTAENIAQTLHHPNEKKMFPALRQKLTGKNRGPELVKVIYLLGREEAISRF